MRPRRRHAATVAALVTAVAGLAACGGSDDPDDGPTSAPTSDVAAASDQPTAAATDAASYLPAPAGVTLTDPGTQLALDDEAVAAWTPRQGLVGVVDVAVTGIERTTVRRSLAGFDLSGAELTATPYFVRTRVSNVGDTDLGARQLPVYLLDSQGALVAATGIDPGFAPCPGSTLPAVFAPGDDAESCLIFLVPAGHEPASVMFRPPEGVVPITWTGAATPLERDRPTKPRRPGSSPTGSPTG